MPNYPSTRLVPSITIFEGPIGPDGVNRLQSYMERTFLTRTSAPFFSFDQLDRAHNLFVKVCQQLQAEFPEEAKAAQAEVFCGDPEEGSYCGECLTCTTGIDCQGCYYGVCQDPFHQ